jgi:hypothetical protein
MTWHSLSTKRIADPTVEYLRMAKKQSISKNLNARGQGAVGRKEADAKGEQVLGCLGP